MLSACLPITGTSSSGIGYPAGPTLAGFGLTDRCEPPDASCTDRAFDVLRTILSSLGERLDEVPVDDMSAVRFRVDFQQDPPYAWRSADGTEGMTEQAVVDLMGLVEGGGPAFVVLGGHGDPGAPAYLVADDLARQLLDALFTAS